MGIPKDYFKKLFARNKVRVKVFDCEFYVNLKNLGAKLDRAQDILDAQVWNDVQMYMPHDTGNLIQQTNMLNQATRGEVYIYPPESDYGHYQHEGVLYVDPVYDVGAFYSPDYGFWSRPGIAKVPSDRELTYSNPKAEPHWGEVAYNKHKQQWVKVAKNALK